MINAIIQPLADFIIFLITKLGYFGIVLAMAIESASIPLPSEIIMPFAGFMVFRGVFNFWLTVLAGSLGCLIGSTIAYAVGFFGGEELVRKLIRKYGRFFLIFEYELDDAEKWFRKHDELIAFTSRLLPVIRTFISLPAGIAKMNFKKFALFTFLGSFLWSAALTYLGKILGENWHTLGGFFHKFDFLIIILTAAFIIWYIRHKVKKHRQRRKA